jgi:hypothetical protein
LTTLAVQKWFPFEPLLNNAPTRSARNVEWAVGDGFGDGNALPLVPFRHGSAASSLSLVQ